MDLLSILPGFATKPYAHILPPLERGKITTVDLITLDTLEIAKRAHVPPADVRRLAARIVEALHSDMGFESNIGTAREETPSSSINADAVTFSLGPATKLQPSRWNAISTMDSAIDALLGGGIPTGYVTEVTGERYVVDITHNSRMSLTETVISGSGKTQFLLSLLLAVQLAEPNGLKKRAIYVSTEHPLATGRLSQLLDCHPYLSSLPAKQAPSLQNILSINAMDLETQDHILNYQLPVAIARYDVGLVVIDSITSNYRAEQSSNDMLALSARSTELAKLGQLLRNLAAKENIAIVIANQVSDRFEPVETNGGGSALRQGFPGPGAAVAARESLNASPLPRNRMENAALVENTVPASSPMASSPYPFQEEDQFDGSYLISNPARNSILSLWHQERFFTGWGDGMQLDTSLKTPALGFVWSTQIACRIALKKEDARPFVAKIDGPYPMSTPVEQTDRADHNTVGKPSLPKPVVSSARELHQAKTAPGSNDGGGESSQNATERVATPKLQSVPEPPEHITKRSMKLVFAPWTTGIEESGDNHGRRRDEVKFEIWKGGLRSTQ